MNPFAKRARLEWRATVERSTHAVRAARAARLRARSRHVAELDRRAILRSAIDGGARVARKGDRYLSRLPRASKWHESRATGLEEVFRRVEDCGEQFAAVARCTSSACRASRGTTNPEAGVLRVPLGCSSRFFCDSCKTRIAVRFRREFQAARLGVIWAATLQGRLSRWRPRFGPEARFSERLLTLTAPHVGTAVERVSWMFKAWPFFLKRWNAYIRDQLGGAECTSGAKRGDGFLTSIPVDRDGCPIELVRTLAQEGRFFEWTAGSDGQGHPHFHVWAFGPFMPIELVREWWREAWQRVSGHVAPSIMVDLRKVLGDTVEERDGDGRAVLGDDGEPKRANIANELIKYLTKDWGAEAEVFAEIYAELFERRARQTSRGFASFSVAQIRICDDCGCLHESERGYRWTIEGVPGSLFEPWGPPVRGPPDWPELPRDDRRQPWVEDRIRDADWKRRWEAASAERLEILRRIGGRIDNANTCGQPDEVPGWKQLGFGGLTE